MADNSCVICGELPRMLSKAISWEKTVMDYYHPPRYETKERLDAIYKRMELEDAIKKHKRICNVYRQYGWLTNRGCSGG
ncbi:hypothetical protein KAR91_31690 [Candidatus Pacearchaeota archaeon]|nr:hypothetical protein [Candidatus Pacearchaeota archaeon]